MVFLLLEMILLFLLLATSVFTLDSMNINKYNFNYIYNNFEDTKQFIESYEPLFMTDEPGSELRFHKMLLFISDLFKYKIKS